MGIVGLPIEEMEPETTGETSLFVGARLPT